MTLFATTLSGITMAILSTTGHEVEPILEVYQGHQITWVAALPDLLRDGTPALAHGGTYANGGVVSGETGETLLPLYQPAYQAAHAANGDVNGDGVDDLLVGGSTIQGGKVVAYSGTDFAPLFRLEDVEYEYGQALAYIGDLDGDNRDDFVLGSPYHFDGKGMIQVISGDTGQLLFQKTGSSAYANLGRRVLGLGDVNADGLGDFSVFDQRDGSVMRLCTYSGSDFTRLWCATLPNGLDLVFGEPLANAGDMNGDGTDDIVVGARWSRQISVLSGSDGSTLWQMRGPEAFGQSVAGGADVNRDGYADILVGAPTEESGKVYCIGGGPSPRTLFTIDHPGASGGRRLAFLGDMDGDHVDEIGVVNFDTILVWSGGALLP